MNNQDTEEYPNYNDQSIVQCVNCGAEISIRDALCNFKLKDKQGQFCRYCPECEDVFNEAVKAVETEEDPTGCVFPVGTVAELGQRDPFFRIRLQVGSTGGSYSWQLVDFEEGSGLMVFIRKITNSQLESMEEQKGFYKLLVPVKIIKKSAKCAFAEPHTEGCVLEEKKEVEAEE